MFKAGICILNYQSGYTSCNLATAISRYTEMCSTLTGTYM